MAKGTTKTSTKRAAAGKKGGQKTAANRASTGATKRGTAPARGGTRTQAPGKIYSERDVRQKLNGLREEMLSAGKPWMEREPGASPQARAGATRGRRRATTAIPGNANSQQESRTGTGG